MAEKTGHYVQHGDVQEWVWDEGQAPARTSVGGYALPETEFDPTGAPHPDDEQTEEPPKSTPRKRKTRAKK